MSNVIEVDFTAGEPSGYVIDDGEVFGIYHEGLAAIASDGDVFVGTKTVDGIDYPTVTTVEDMNKFCLMWLLIFDPEVINED